MTAVNGLNTWEICAGSNTGFKMFRSFCMFIRLKLSLHIFSMLWQFSHGGLFCQRICKGIKKCTVVGFARHLGHLFKLVGLKEPTLSNEHNLNGFILDLSWF